MIITHLKYKCLFFFFLKGLAVLSLHCCSGFSLFAASWNYSLAVVRGLLTTGASLVAEHGL